MKTVDATYEIYIVKKNDGKVIRLTNLDDVLRFATTGKKDDIREIEISEVETDFYQQDIIQKNCIIWYSLTNPRFYEATIEDDRAKQENAMAISVIDSIPDSVDEGPGTLVKVIGSVYRIVDGSSRRNECKNSH